MIDPTNINLESVNTFEGSSNKRESIVPFLIVLTMVIPVYYIIKYITSKNEIKE